jgi:predicted nuclease of predicted toxin-antitoxin system
MRFLIDADLPRSLVQLAETHDHAADFIDDVGLKDADDRGIAEFARIHHVCIVSGDFGFADVRNYPPQKYYGLVVLELPTEATAKFIRELFNDFMGQTEIVKKLPGRLAIVSAGRVRLRPN